MRRLWRTMRVLWKRNWRRLKRKAAANVFWAPIFFNFWKIAIAVILCMTLTATGSYVVGSRRPTMTLTLKYANASKGLNPNGTRFNMFEITSDEVLDRAIELGNLEFDADYLASRIDVFAQISNNASRKVRSSASEGDDLKYIADEYVISYSQKNKLTTNQAEDVLRSVALAYTEYFAENYSENNKLFSEPLPDFSEYEYIEVERILRDKAIALERYFQKRSEENTDFVSSAGLNYQDLYTIVNNYRTINLEKYRGYVQKYGLAKDDGSYIAKLEYSNQMLARDKRKYDNAYNFRVRAIGQYDAKITGVMLVPSVDTAKEFYMNRTKTGVDYLTEDAYGFATKANSVQDEINKNTAIIENIRANGLAGSDYDTVKASADGMITQLEQAYQEICKQAKEIDDEYLEYKSKDYVSFRFANTSLMGYINKKFILLIGAGVFVLACAYFHLKAYLDRLIHLQKDQEEKSKSSGEEGLEA